MENLQINEPIKFDLRKLSSWLKFLSILNYIYFALSIILMIFLLIGSISMMNDRYTDESTGAILFVMTLIFGSLFCLALLLSAMYGIRVSSNINNALISNNQEYLDKAFNSLGSYFKLHGILAIIWIIVSILYFIFSFAVYSSAPYYY